MIAQLSYQLHRPEALLKPPAPDSLILDSSQLIDKLRKGMRDCDITEETEIVDSVIQSLQFHKNALMELEFSCRMLIGQRMGMECVTDYEPIITAMATFGYALFEQLERLNAYNNGYLFYQFRQMLGADIVLMRIQPPELNH